MGDIIFFKKYDNPLEIEDKFGKRKVTGEWACTDTGVQKVFFLGGMGVSKESTMTLHIFFLFKDGGRYEQQILTEREMTIEAEEILSQINEGVLKKEYPQLIS